MVCLALVLELHHPLPGPADDGGAGWAAAAILSDWPILRAVSDFAERRSGGAITLAVSPSWMAMASDLSVHSRLLSDLGDIKTKTQRLESFREFLVDRWHGDATSLVRVLARSGAVDVIPTTSSHTWLPSVAQDPVVARAQIRLAAADHTRRLGVHPSGIWLPFLGYRAGLESVMGESGLRYFGVGSAEFLRGSIFPPAHVFAPMVTPAGVAVFAVSPEPSRQVVDPNTGYGLDRRYLDPVRAGEAATDHARHFLDGWRAFATSGSRKLESNIRPISVVHLPACDLGSSWLQCRGRDWLSEVLAQLGDLEEATAVSLRDHLAGNPVGVLGRPGPSAGGMLSARPGNSDLFDRCRAAADLLVFAVEHHRSYCELERRCVAHMTRSLLRAQQVDWSFPQGLGIDSETGLIRARAHLDRFYRLAGSLMAGRPDRRLLVELDRGPAYLPEIDLELLSG